MTAAPALRLAAGLLAALPALLGAARPTDHPPAQHVSAQDKAYLQKTVVSDLLEMASAHVARQRSPSAAVRGLALRLLADHDESHLEALGLAHTFNVRISDQLDESSDSKLHDLRYAPAAHFDDKYLSDELDDHRKAIADTVDEIRNGSNDTIVAWAKTDLYMLDAHLVLVRETAAGLPASSAPAVPSPAASPVARTVPDAVHSPGRQHALTYPLLLAVGIAALLLGVGSWIRRRV